MCAFLKQIKMYKKEILISWLLITLLLSCHYKQENSNKGSLSRNKLDSYLKKCENNGFNGAVLIVKNDDILLNKGYGLASKQDKIPITSNTVFDICSVSKQFTAAAILKLEESGKLKLTDSLKMYFTEIPLSKGKITIHQLLTHSAGFGHDIGNGDFDYMTRQKYFQELFNSKLKFTPGEDYSYSNSGYSILGRIIELVSGKSYEQFLKEKFFDPLGMNQTGYLLPEWKSSSIANEYLYNVIDKGNQISRYKEYGKIAWTLKANGGINSTQNDMYKWYKALSNNKVLTSSSMEKLVSPHIAEFKDNSSYYGYGWVTFQSTRNTKVITHNGFNGISYYEFIWFPDEDALILFATNTFSRNIARIPSELEKILFNEEYIVDNLKQDPISQLLSFSEQYSGDIKGLGEILKLEFSELLKDSYYLNRLSGIYLREKQFDKAISIAEINIELFPLDGNLWDTMGDIYLKANNLNKAKKSYLKALELKPNEASCGWCENSIKQLNKME